MLSNVYFTFALLDITFSLLDITFLPTFAQIQFFALIEGHKFPALTA